MLVKEGAGWAVVEGLALMEHDQPVRDLLQLSQQVAAEEDGLALLTQAAQQVAQDRRAPRVWPDQPEQQANGGRFPGPIGTDKPGNGPGRDTDGEPIDSGAFAKMLAQALRLNGEGPRGAARSGTCGSFRPG